jgi:hydrogenase-4 component F
MMTTFLVAVPLATACLIGFLLPAKSVRFIGWSAIFASSLDFLLALFIVPRVVSVGSTGPAFWLSLDALAAFLVLIITLVGFFASLYSVGYLQAEVEKGIIGPNRVRQYFLLFELFMFAMLLAVSTTHPVVMWIAIEATTLSTAFLISFYNKPSATEAAWKYLILNSLGLLLSLLGTLIFLALPQIQTGITDWSMLQASAASFHPLAVKIAFVFILVGYGTKVGLVPLHTWKPDTYAKAPTPMAGLLASVLINVALFGILRFKTVTDASIGTGFSSGLFVMFGTISIVLAALIIFIQKNYKRMLAYSGIEHAGIMALGFGFGGIGTFAALLHMLYHALVKAMLFFTAGNIFLKYSTTKMKQITGVLSVLPLSSVLFFGGFIAIAGLPPFGIFATKLLILSAGMMSYPWISGIVLFALAVVFFGFFRHVTAMLFGPIPQDIEPGESNMLTKIPIVLMAAIIIIVSFDLPETISSIVTAAAASLTQPF